MRQFLNPPRLPGPDFLAVDATAADRVANVLADWRSGLDTLEIALKRFNGDRSMEPKVVRIIRDERDARLFLRSSGGSA